MVSEKNAAKEEITKSLRDLLTFNITVPLGNPSYKLIHTNKFVKTSLPEDFVLDNFGVIGEKLASNSTRNTKYIINDWYVESVTINNDGTNFKMDLELNPFASSIDKNKDNIESFAKAYKDATEKAEKSSTTSSKSSSKSTGSKTIDKVVDNAIKGKSKALDKAKAIDKAFKNHIIYSFYYDANKTKGKTSNFESAWKNAHLNCADGANILSAMFRYAGLTATIIHTKHSKAGHYIVRLTIDGKYYYTDNAAKSGRKTTRSFGKVWEGITKGTNKGTIVT